MVPALILLLAFGILGLGVHLYRRRASQSITPANPEYTPETPEFRSSPPVPQTLEARIDPLAVALDIAASKKSAAVATSISAAR